MFLNDKRQKLGYSSKEKAHYDSRISTDYYKDGTSSRSLSKKMLIEHD